MYLRRNTFNECKGNPRLQKALAFAIQLKHLLGRTSTMHNYTINKIHRLTGLSATTIKKYLPVLKSMGWVRLDGKHGEHLIVCRLSSSKNRRNISIDKFCFDTFKDIHNSLRAFLVMAIQARKDYVRRTLCTYRNPSTTDELKRARNKMRGLVKRGVIPSIDTQFKELGVSLARMARETGNCIRTVQRVVGYAVRKQWCVRHHHSIRHQLKGIGFRDGLGFFTYSTKDYIVIMKSNTYELNEDISLSFSVGTNSW